MHRTLTTYAQWQFKFSVFQKGMILPKPEDGFFPEREGLLLLKVTAETVLWYNLTDITAWCKKYAVNKP